MLLIGPQQCLLGPALVNQEDSLTATFPNAESKLLLIQKLVGGLIAVNYEAKQKQPQTFSRSDFKPSSEIVWSPTFLRKMSN